jgi:predicted transcriptional regulator
MPSNDAFVESDKFRKAVFAGIASGEPDPERIAKKNHLLERGVERAVDDLEEHGLIEPADDGYTLTDKGEKYAAERENLNR